MSTFGTVVSAADLEEWFKNFVEKWIQEYMAEYERQKGFPARRFALPFQFESSSEFTYWNADRLPHIVFVSPGMVDPPVRDGGGEFRGSWLIAATAVVGGRDRQDTRETQMAYATCLRWMVAQWRNLERPEVRGATLVDESYRDVPVEDSTTIAAATSVFEVEVEGIMSDRGTPPFELPREDPYTPPEEPPIVQPDPDNPTMPRPGSVRIELKKEINP